MKQIFHIWAKDARHLWHEILISLALTVAFVLTYPTRWEGGALSHQPNRSFVFGAFGPEGSALNLLSDALTVLIPLSWWLLISSAIHAERLIGDSQFWLTRPYEWKKLLAAKVLFLVSFIYLPIFAAKCLLLLRAGFHPFAYLPALLDNLLQVTAFLVLPLVALATATRNFGRMTLAVLGVLVCLIGFGTLSAMVPGTSIASPYGDRIFEALLILGCTLVAVLQYATRNLKMAWPLLIALFVVVEGIAIAAPDQALMNHSFPKPADQTPAVVEFKYPREAGIEPSAFVGRRNNEIGIDVPVHVSGVPDGSVVIPNNLQVNIETADGSSWTSVWQPVYMDMFVPGGKIARASFSMPRSVYEKYKSRPLNLRITFALTKAQVDKVIRIPLPTQGFPVPGFGFCIPETGYAEQPDEIGGIACQAPMRRPNLALVHVIWLMVLAADERR